MKMPHTIVFVIASSLLALLNVSAQEMSFEDDALIQLKKFSEQAVEGKKLRIVTVEERFENDDTTPVSFSKSINEILPPDRNRFIYEKRTASGIERTEYIDIGEKSFVRRNGGEWEIVVPSGTVIGGGMGNGNGIIPKVETTIVKSLIKGETVNNQSADLYKTVESRKYIYPDKTYINVSTESFWFDRRGMLIKSFREFQDGERKNLSRTTEEYEYNPSFNIVAPTIKSKPKTKS